MKTSLAYYQGKFNSVSFKWQTGDKCKISLVDDTKGLEGSFVAQYDQDKVMVKVDEDSEMEPIKKGGPPPAPPAPGSPGGGS